MIAGFTDHLGQKHLEYQITVWKKLQITKTLDGQIQFRLPVRGMAL